MSSSTCCILSSNMVRASLKPIPGTRASQLMGQASLPVMWDNIADPPRYVISYRIFAKGTRVWRLDFSREILANGNSEINRIITTAAHVILSEAKNLREDTAFLRDSSRSLPSSEAKSSE